MTGEFSVYQWEPTDGAWLALHHMSVVEAAGYCRELRRLGEFAFVARPEVVHPAETAGLLGFVWQGVPHTDPQRDRQARKRQILGVM